MKSKPIKTGPPKLFTVFTDSEGLTYSWSRVICTVMVMAGMSWGTFLVIKDHKIPDFTSLALLIGAVYGVNRVGEAFGDKPKSTSPASAQ